MKTLLGFAAALVLVSAISTSASAVVLFDSGATTLDAGDPTQLGRLFRDAVPSDWSASKAYPGEANTGTSYRYLTFDIAITNTPYIQISIDDSDATFFASAYEDSYSPLDKSLNYLGDAGSSGNFFGNPAFFQVIVPTGHHLILLVNNTATSDVDSSFSVLVEGFVDTEYTDPVDAPAPEPSTWAMLMAGFSGIGFARYRRSRKGTSA